MQSIVGVVHCCILIFTGPVLYKTTLFHVYHEYAFQPNTIFNQVQYNRVQLAEECLFECILKSVMVLLYSEFATIVAMEVPLWVA